jgi:hypothetical protein
MMNDKEIERLIKSTNTEIIPPEGLKDKILCNTLSQFTAEPALNAVERFIFKSPLRVACIFSIVISGILWAALGSDMIGLLSSIVGVNAI